MQRRSECLAAGFPKVRAWGNHVVPAGSEVTVPRPTQRLTNPFAGPAVPGSSGASAADAGALTFRHFPQLDGLRGLAILLVIIGHALQYGFGSVVAGAL